MKQHPIIKELFCNEDGTEIIYKDNPLHISYMHRNNQKESGVVSIRNRKISVVKIICECYHGMREDKSLFPVRADANNQNNHYTNLSWGRRRGQVKIIGKIKENLYADFEKGLKVKDLAKKYNVSKFCIYNHKKNHFAASLDVVDAEYVNP